ncbi:unnamed protein product, partial [Allacma fusca]
QLSQSLPLLRIYSNCFEKSLAGDLNWRIYVETSHTELEDEGGARIQNEHSAFPILKE